MFLPQYMTPIFFFFFFNDTATTEIYTLSLHDALPISFASCCTGRSGYSGICIKNTDSVQRNESVFFIQIDRKSTRLNSSHTVISYAVFCLKKKKRKKHHNSYQDAQYDLQRGNDLRALV